ncbi:MAG: hypothetical protein ACPIOQ_70435, partial [Promethearchaeia archaeon]
MLIPPLPSPPDTKDWSMLAEDPTALLFSIPALLVTDLPAPKDSHANPVLLTALPEASLRLDMSAPFMDVPSA